MTAGVDVELLGWGAELEALGCGAGVDVDVLGWGVGAVSVSVGSGSGSGEAEVDSLGLGSGESEGLDVGLLVGSGFLPLPSESAGVLADSFGFGLDSSAGSSVGEAAGLAGCDAEGESVGSGVLADALVTTASGTPNAMPKVTKARPTLVRIPGLFPDGLVKALMPPPPFSGCLLLRITKLLTRPPGDLTTWASVTPLYLTDYLYNSTLS